MYHLPWDVPLPYGPVLWLPYVLPHLLAFDSRVWTLAAALTVPAACGLAAAAVGRTRPIAAASLLALVVALAWQPQILAFLANGQTLMYWPLLAVLAVLVARGRWTAACITAGLLVAARTTMVSIVPVLIIALHRRGELSWRRVGLVAAAALGPFLPFLIDDPRNVIYGMYGSYQTVVKGFVWHQTNWVATTFGTTRLLLARDLGRYVEPVQAAVLIVVYGAAWVALRARRSPLPWMVLALLAFSMTTLWPVTYVYFDVWVLAASSLAVTAWPARDRAPGAIGFVAAAWALAATAVLVAGARAPGAAYSIDVGTPASTGMTGGGFGADTSVVEDGRTFVWVQGPVARIRVPRAGLFGARVRVTLRPYSPEPGLRQMVTAMLNERTLGTRTLSDGWQEVTFDTGRSDWLYGFNVLDLHFAYAVSAASLGVGPDTTERSAAIDRVTIE